VSPEISPNSIISLAIRGSLPITADLQLDPTASPTLTANSELRSLLATPRIPEDPNMVSLLPHLHTAVHYGVNGTKITVRILFPLKLNVLVKL
jgi:hypothetical protein